MTNFFAILFSLVSTTATTNAPSWLQSGQFAGWWDPVICRTAEVSWEVPTNGTYRVQWRPAASDAWLYLTPLLNSAETNKLVVQLTVPKETGYFRAVKQQP